jgi:hypothetical protein
MPDTSLLFFAGAFGVAALLRLFTGSRLTDRHPVIATALVVAGTLVITLTLAFLALVTLQKWLVFGPWPFAYWITLGRGNAFLIGALAGVVIAHLLEIAMHWTPTTSAWNLLPILLSGGVAVFLLYMVAVPGVFQSLGLTGIKAGGVEITLSTPSRSGATPNVPSFTPVGTSSSLGILSNKYSPWFQNLWPMLQPLSDPSGKEFDNRGYFQREAGYLQVIDDVTDLPATKSEAGAHPPEGLAMSIWQQAEFLRSLKPLVGCAGYYHLFSPDVRTSREILWPFLEQLVAVEQELENSAKSLDPPDTWRDDLIDRAKTLSSLGGGAIAHFREILRNKPELAAENPEAPSAKNCEEGQDKDGLLQVSALMPVDRDGTYNLCELIVQPPYLAMFIANSYAALGAKDAGIQILYNWIKYYDNQVSSWTLEQQLGRCRKRDQAPAPEQNQAPSQTPITSTVLPSWLMHRAALEYGIVQEADEPIPITTAALFYLNRTEAMVRSKWPVNLDTDGYICRESEYQEGLRNAEAAGVAAIRQAAKARLNILYSNILQRLLYAAAETGEGLDDPSTMAHYDYWARQLIRAADRCLVPENQGAREFRQSLNRVSGGIMLARLAEHGPQLGFYTDDEANETRFEALRALRAARPILKQNEDREAAPDGLLRKVGSDWEVHRRVAEHEILDLQVKLAR